MTEAVQLESPAETAVALPEPKPEATARLVSFDAFRGLVMALILNERLRLPEVALSFPHSTIWAAIAYNTDHVRVARLLAA